MATTNYGALNAAHGLGLFSHALSEDLRLALHPTVVICSGVIYSIALGGSTVAQLAEVNRLNRNTVLVFLRWAEGKGLVSCGGVRGNRPSVWVRCQKQ
jgi:hypothetical protein